MRRDIRLNWLALALLLLGLGASSFFIARAVLPPSQQAQAQPGQPPDGEIERKVREDNAKPKFEGVLNGFRFYGSTNPPSPPPQCPAEGGQPSSAGEIAASQLNFTVGYLPPGMKLTYEGGNTCSGTVVTIARNYAAPNGAMLIVGRGLGEPATEREAPADRLEPSTIGGRPAVIKKPVFPGDRFTIYMRDDAGTLWIVSGFRLTVAEGLKVAEGLR